MKNHKLFSYELIALTLALCFIWVLMMSVFPISVLISADLGMEADEFGRIIGAASMIMLILNIPFGILADKYGKKKFILLGVVCAFLAAMLLSAAGNKTIFAAGWLLGGIGRGMFLSPVYSLIADRYPMNTRGKAFAFLSGGIGFGSMGGYFISALITSLFGWQKAFFVIGMGILCSFPFVLFIREGGREAPKADNGIGNLINDFGFFLHKDIIKISCIGILGFCIATGLNYTLPYTIQNSTISLMSLSVLFIPYEFTGIIGNFILGAVSDKIGRVVPLRVSLGFVAMSILYFIHGNFSYFGVLAAFMLIALCESPLIGLTTSMIVDEAKLQKRKSGGIMGCYRTIYSLGSALGPFICGIAIKYWDVRGCLFLMLALAVLIIILSILYKGGKRYDAVED